MLLSVTEHAAARGVQQCLEMYYLWNQYEICSPVPCCFRSWKCRSELHLDQCFLCLAQRQLSAHSPGDCPQRPMDTEPLDSVPESPQPGASSHMKADGDWLKTQGLEHFVTWKCPLGRKAVTQQGVGLLHHPVWTRAALGSLSGPVFAHLLKKQIPVPGVITPGRKRERR